MDAYHLCEPSPQRTPILFQAGGSARGRDFAARHAECVFISGRNPKMAAEIVSDLRERARRMGRDPAGFTIFTALTAVAGETDAGAQSRLADYRKHVSAEGSIALLSGYLGIDFAGKNLDEPLESQEINAIQSCVEGFKRVDPSRQWTLRDAVERLGVAGYKPLLAGSPKTVADGLVGWMEESGIDGFNIEYIVSPKDFAAFVDLVVPELQRRGVYKTKYEEGTLREKLFGKGRKHLPVSHPGARYRHGIARK
jgi:alkanesulfonate monooxygenase